ncbi:low temperature requirement protein A [Micromonospora sp. C28SCA-DRY-2]|uniref:low temperature requirement protein A n=1 Tax=Micromonospora sp. C28SCA-DRY-2 TaxID=3059522 RepID=UPI0026765D62|nr:low temperature requirement protein A [Micromonospora sp. C28SCA-DRY-2]MDO3701337.1 low temperature requirement protein A [Micromonospora sp. C28SCA-DRY-2]
MVTRAGAGRLGDTAIPRSATVLELLFDIVYVFALARLAGRVADDLTFLRHALLSEAGQTVLFFTAMWMVWSLNALMTSAYDPRRADIQILLLASMFGTLVLAVSLPQAFGERGVIFSVTYVLIQVGRPLYLTLAWRGDPAWRAPARVLSWHVLSGVFWIAGGISGGLGRGVFWTIALGIEILGFALSWPAPRLGATRPNYRTISFDHLAERYNQFFMIALAEVVLETGAAIGFPGFSTKRTAVLVAAFLAVVAFWRIYFYHGGPRDPATAGRPTEAAMRLSEWSSFGLLLIVGGVICTAVGFGQVVEDPAPPVDWALVVVIFGGPALFLIGRASLDRPSRGEPRCRVLSLGVLALAVVAPVTLLLPPIAAALAVALILTGIAVYDGLVHRPGPETNPAF